MKVLIRGDCRVFNQRRWISFKYIYIFVQQFVSSRTHIAVHENGSSEKGTFTCTYYACFVHVAPSRIRVAPSRVVQVDK